MRKQNPSQRHLAAVMPWLAFFLAAVNGPSMAEETGRGTLTGIESPRTVSLTMADLQSRLNMFEEGKWILSEAGPLKCGVDVFHYQYNTVDGRGKPVTASSALMVPTGSDPKCTGAHPVVMGLHGTVADKAYNLADLSGKNSASPRAIAFAATYASQGYVVIAPNYVGFDTSSGTYHPYLDADQQSKDVIDALGSARTLMGNMAIQFSDKLFLVGYSQGGFVAMASHRAMQEAGIKVTASMPSAGPYAMSAIVDDIFMGRPVGGAALYLPMAFTAWQMATGKVYNKPEELYNVKYAPAIENVLPSNESLKTLIEQGKMSPIAVFGDTKPQLPANASAALKSAVAYGTPAIDPQPFASMYAIAFGKDPLLNDKARVSYMADVLAHPDGAIPNYTTGAVPPKSNNPLRRAAIANDLRNWTPKTPVVMCGGRYDGAVPFRLGAELMMQYWNSPGTAAPAGMASVLDFEAQSVGNDPYAALRKNFVTLRKQSEIAKPGLMDIYHQLLVPRYCYTAARTLFDSLK